MTRHSSNDGVDRESAVTIDFATKYAESDQFKAIFREGMSLVEATAAYLDGDGRRESRSLEQDAALAYASESMRLTTRLMQLASWLLVRRAVNEGELSSEEALLQNNRVDLKPYKDIERSSYFGALPTSLQDLIETTDRLITRVIKLDSMLSDNKKSGEVAHANPLTAQMDKLNAAFDGGTGK